MTSTAIPASAETRVFRPLTAILLVLAGVFSFSAYIVLSAYAPDLRGGDDGGAHALSRSAVGYAGMVRLLCALNVPVQINRDGPTKHDPAWSLLVVTPDEATKSADLSKFTTAAGPTLVVLPKWETTPDQANTGWVKNSGLVDADALKALLADRVAVSVSRRTDTAPVQLTNVETQGSAAMATGPIAQLQTLTAEGMTTVMSDASGAAVLVRTADSRLFVLSDPDLLNTQGLRDLATARAGMGLIGAVRSGDGPVVFDVSLNGFHHSPSLLKLAFEPPFLGATLCLAGAALLMALHAMSRFGAPSRTTRALALGKRALAENSAGLIRMAKREPHMAPGYLDLSRAEVLKALGATRVTGAELDAYINRLGEHTGAGRLSTLVGEAPLVRDREGLIRFARRLFQWRLEMTRERR